MLTGIGQSTVLILKEAEKQGIAWESIPGTAVFQLNYQGKTKFFHHQVPSATTELAAFCCSDKSLAKKIFKNAGLSVSKGRLLNPHDLDKCREAFHQLQKPLVVKPVDGMRGDSVSLNINTLDEYFLALTEIADSSDITQVLVEQMFQGDEYRILATKEKVLSVIQRLPANVTGDGKKTILQLIAKKNQDPIRQKVVSYKPITIDEDVISYLRDQGFTLKSIVPNGRQVFLRLHSALDITLGGDTVDVTDDIHPSVHAIVQTIMKSIPGLALTGIDYMTKNIYAEQTPDSYRIIEINSSPSLDWNEFPLEGPRRRVAYEFLRLMFPGLPAPIMACAPYNTFPIPVNP